MSADGWNQGQISYNDAGEPVYMAPRKGLAPSMEDAPAGTFYGPEGDSYQFEGQAVGGVPLTAQPMADGSGDNAQSGIPGEDGTTFDPDYTPAGDGYVPDYDPTFVNKAHGDKQARKTMGRLTRAEWEDYKRRFRPIEDELIGMVGDSNTMSQDVGRSVSSVNQAFDTTQGQRRRQNSRYGIPSDSAEMQDVDRQMGLAQTKATTEAANRTRRRVKDRNMRVMAGSLSPASQRDPSNT